MLLAKANLSPDAQRVYAERGLTGFCPDCELELVPHCGPVKNPYWSHFRRGDCDADAEDETEWSLAWKRRFPTDMVEISMPGSDSGNGNSNGDSVHRADVFNGRFAILFRAKSLKLKNIASLEAAWPDMVWVLDGYRFIDFFSGFKAKDIHAGGGTRRIHGFRWYYARKALLHATKPIFIDFNSPQYLFQILRMVHPKYTVYHNDTIHYELMDKDGLNHSPTVNVDGQVISVDAYLASIGGSKNYHSPDNYVVRFLKPAWTEVKEEPAVIGFGTYVSKDGFIETVTHPPAAFTYYEAAPCQICGSTNLGRKYFPGNIYEHIRNTITDYDEAIELTNRFISPEERGMAHLICDRCWVDHFVKQEIAPNELWQLNYEDRYEWRGPVCWRLRSQRARAPPGPEPAPNKKGVNT